MGSVGTVVVSSSPDSVFIKSCDGSSKVFSGFVKSLKWNLNPRTESPFAGKYYQETANLIGGDEAQLY